MAKSDHTPKRAPRSPAVTVTVTKETIDAATKRDSQHCMIAETIASSIPNAHNVLVDTATIRWTDPDKGLRYIFLTPQSARNAIYSFDHGDVPEPFSFHLRAAQVRGVRRKDGSKKRMTTESWEKIREQIKKISSEKGIKFNAIAKQMGVAKGTLYTRLNDDQIPTAANVDKMEKWVLDQTGEKPAPRVKSLTDQASGRARFRSEKSTKREQPEIIGGGHPPFDGTLAFRQFGLRQLHWKT